MFKRARCPELENRNTNLVWRAVGVWDWQGKEGGPEARWNSMTTLEKKTRDGAAKPQEAKYSERRTPRNRA